MKINRSIAVVTLGVFALLGVGVTSAYAYNESGGFGNKPAPEHMEEVRDAVESGDYEQWKSVVSEDGRGQRVLEDITSEEDFSKFVEMHALMQAGEYEQADAIREELGLPERGMGRGKGMHRNMVDENGDGVCDRLDAETEATE